MPARMLTLGIFPFSQREMDDYRSKRDDSHVTEAEDE